MRVAFGWDALCLLSLASSVVRADALSSQSSAGVQSEYASNPLMFPTGAQAAESLAVVASIPLTFTTNTMTFDLTPRLRYGETHGPEALLSNYEYLDGDWRWTRERDTFTVTAGWHHDSTLYNEFEDVALLGRTLGRVEQTAAAAWQHAFSERDDVQLSASWDQVQYNHNAGSALANYCYSQVAAEDDVKLSERWEWQNTVGYGRYQLPDGVYTSDEQFAQTSLSRPLSERWTANIQGGYAHLTAQAVGYTCGEIVIGPDGGLYCLPVALTETSSKGSPNYGLSFEHRDERLVLDLAASRSIQPSGIGALLTQDSITLSGNIPWTERLNLGASVGWQRLSDSLDRLNLESRHYYQFSFTAGWQWTEKWTLQLTGTYTQQYLGPNIPEDSGATVYFTLSRQFGRLQF